ncbi:hypothetical protein, partial [Microbacterium sp.]|uniref:hypothetical protein n=1 Tax=Microbacterium sp. TaxID=51671 RepID=UPI003A8FF22A
MAELIDALPRVGDSGTYGRVEVLIAAIVVTLAIGWGAGASPDPVPSADDDDTGWTTAWVETAADSVEIGASQTRQPPADVPSEHQGHGGGHDGGGTNYRDTPEAGVPLVAVDCVAPVVACAANPTPAPTPAAKGRVIPAVTVSDLVSFRPVVPGLSSEPDGVGVVGLPTNLLADTATQTLHGMLFEFPVAVRFTPDHYTFTYGDGNATTTRTPGRAWAASGDPQFTPTITSHAYRER